MSRPHKDSDFIKQAAIDNADLLFEQLVGQPHNRRARLWRHGSKGSFMMHMSGPKRGLWKDWESGDRRRDILDFVAVRHLGLNSAKDDFGGTLKATAALLGIAGETVTPEQAAALHIRKAATAAASFAEEAAEAQHKAKTVARRLEAAQRVNGSPAQDYLNSRGIERMPPASFAGYEGGYCPELVIWASDDAGAAKGGQGIALTNRTPRKLSFGFTGGYPARLLADAPDGPLFVAEGPETALTIWQATGCETWAVFGASNFQAAPLPTDRTVILCPDADAPDSAAGKSFAKACAHHAARGVDVYIALSGQEVGSKKDLNDTLQEQGPEAVKAALEAAKPFHDTDTPRDAKGRYTGLPALATDKPAPAPEFVTVEQAGERIRDAVRRFVQDKPPVMAIAASPGAGKSRHAREVLAKALPDLGGDVAFYTPTLPLAEEAAEHFQQLGVQAIVVRGRLAQDIGREERFDDNDMGLMCLRPQLVEAAQKAGLGIGQSVCKRGKGEQEERCPKWNSCPWVKQWEVPEGPIVRCMAHNYLHLPDGSGRGKPALHVVDESCWQGAYGKGEVPFDSWLQARSPSAFDMWAGEEKAADMLAAARDVLTMLQDGADLFQLALTWKPEELREFAKAEDQRPILGFGPSLSDEKLLGKLKNANAIDKHAGKRAAVWRVLADAIEAGLDKTERVLIRDGKIVVHWRKDLPDGATLHLDADADETILGAMYPEAAIEIVRAELRPRADVVQVTDQTFSKRALIGTPEAPAGAGKRAEICRLVRVEVMHDRAQRGGGVLCVASKAVVAQIFADAGAEEPKLGAELHGATWIWFGPASKGLNTWRDFGTVIEIGREELPPSAIEDQARGLFGDGPEPLQFPAPDERGNVLAPKVVLPILMADGQALGMLGRAYADKRLRALQGQSREGAGRQGAERLRMAHSIGQKRWLRLNNVPLPTVPVAEVTTWGDLLPDRLTGALADAAQRQGFLRLSAKGLAQDAPAEFSTAKAAERWLDESYTPRTPSNDSIRGTGGITAQIRLKGQRGPRPTRVIIPAAPSPEAAKAALEQVLGPLAHFEVLETVPTPVDLAINEQVKRLEHIEKTLGYVPTVTVRDVKTPVFVAGSFLSGDVIAAFHRRGWQADLVPT